MTHPAWLGASLVSLSHLFPVLLSLLLGPLRPTAPGANILHRYLGYLPLFPSPPFHYGQIPFLFLSVPPPPEKRGWRWGWGVGGGGWSWSCWRWIQNDSGFAVQLFTKVNVSGRNCNSFCIRSVRGTVHCLYTAS